MQSTTLKKPLISNISLESEILHENSQIESFDCGEKELNHFLKEFAFIYQKRRFGITVVFFQKTDEEKKIVGFYTICPSSIQQENLPQKYLTGPRPNPIPGFRICRLALDLKFHKKGLGQFIFIHALKKCVDQAHQIGGNTVIIDAKNENAKLFYEKFGFMSLTNNPLILVQSIKFLQTHFQDA